MTRRTRKARGLDVYQNGQIVGKLEQASTGAFSFTYSKEWIDTPDSFPISRNLPIREEAFRGREALDFFDNLLPDQEDVREKIASRVLADSQQTFDLLFALGEDCVGALQFVPEGRGIPSSSGLKGKLLRPKEIEDRIQNLGFFPLGLDADTSDFRISIAGVQEKTALLKKRGKWYLPKSATPTTHILKPPMGIIHSGIDLSTSVENEWLCLKICEHMGLDVAQAEIENFGSRRCLVVERFDRRWIGKSRLIRLPQEDLCQALGYPSTKKYQADGGPGIVDIMGFLNGSDERARDRATFMRSQLAFFLLAATDGHAKNFSVFLTKSGFRLTPLYDVMSVFPAISKKQIAQPRAKLAMSVGNSKHYKLKEISRRHFAQTAKSCGFPQRDLDAIIEDVVTRTRNLESAIKLPRNFPKWIFESIIQGVRKQSARLAE